LRSNAPLVEIISTGRFLPPKVTTNADLEALVNTTDEWITGRTGIKERRLAEKNMSTAQMGASASFDVMSKANLGPSDIDLIILSTATPDRLLPSTACDIQALIGANNAVAFDIGGACSGFLYGLSMAEGYIAAGRADNVLVVASEKMSSIVDWTDRSTCVLFGDGAGACIVQKSEGRKGIIGTHHGSDGKLAELLYRPAGGALIPSTPESMQAGDHLVKMAGKEVYRHAVRSMAEASQKALEDAGILGEDVDLLIPHQANMRIIESTARHAGIPMDKVFVNVDRYGNMSSATIPVALDEALEQGILQGGMNVLTVAFGAGFTWGAVVIRW
jgi:3-oxoacyl-[acyl-carrier-protein] synthase-3